MPCQRAGCRCTRSWEGTQPGQLTQTGQSDIPCHVTSCSAYKLGELAAGSDRWLGTGWALVSGRWAVALCNTCFVYSFTIIIIVIIILSSFSVLLSCHYLSPRVLSFFLIPFPIPRKVGGRSERMAVWCLAACRAKPQQHQYKSSCCLL